MPVAVDQKHIKKCIGNMLINLLFIQIIVVIITDLSDWPKTVYKTISFILTKGRIVKDNLNWHLVSCSFCQTHWIGLLFLILTSQLTLGSYCLLLLLSFLTPVTNSILLNMRDLMSFLLNKISNIWLKTNMD